MQQQAGRAVAQGRITLQLSTEVAHDLELVEDLAQGPGDCEGGLLGRMDFDGRGELQSWVEAARATWLARQVNSLSAQAEQLQTQQRLAQAIPMAERIVALAPDQEHAHRRLMRLHWLRGDRSAARAAYESCRLWLQRELDMEPSADTRRLAVAIEADSDAEVAGAPVQPMPESLRRPPRLIGLEDAWRWLVHSSSLARQQPVVQAPRLPDPAYPNLAGERHAKTPTLHCRRLARSLGRMHHDPHRHHQWRQPEREAPCH
jgi:hypothetical protein